MVTLLTVNLTGDSVHTVTTENEFSSNNASRAPLQPQNTA